jgi:hypothetical protein
MNLEFWNTASENNKRHENLAPNMPEPSLKVSEAEAEEKTFGLSALQLDVHKDNDTYCRFWITVRIRRGRPVVQITTKHPKTGKETTKEISGSYKKQSTQNASKV